MIHRDNFFDFLWFLEVPLPTFYEFAEIEVFLFAKQKTGKPQSLQIHRMQAAKPPETTKSILSSHLGIKK